MRVLLLHKRIYCTVCVCGNLKFYHSHTSDSMLECFACRSVVIVNLTAFMMQPIHYANPVQLLCDETVEISHAKRWKFVFQLHI